MEQLIPARSATTFCGGDSVILQATPASRVYLYLWKKNANIPGATSNTFHAKSSGNYFVVISDSSGCVNSSNIISVAVLSNAPTLTSSSGYICPDQNVILSVDKN